MSGINNLLKNIPPRTVSPIKMEYPNDRIDIYKGDFTLKNDQVEFQLNGEIFFTWIPDTSVKFAGTFQGHASIDIRMSHIFDVIIDGQTTGKVEMTDYDLTSTPVCGGNSADFIWGDSTIPVKEITFAIPNLRDYLGDNVKDEDETGVRFQKTRITLEDKPYKIILDKLPDYKAKLETLKQSGGYLLLYGGKITKSKGSISLGELQKWHDRFHHFLYFLNGRRTAPMFYSGIHENQQIWTDYSVSIVDQYKFVQSWSDIFYLNDVPHLWKKYNQLWADPNHKDFLITAIHWYVEANSNAGMVEGSIILIQTALELLYNWVIVENERLIIGPDADGLSAANKIRLLISRLNISSEIPPALRHLSKLKDVEDGPEILVKIRNALIHGQLAKRMELAKISLMAKHEALQMGIWYTELAILYVLDYQGKYNNRVNGNLWRNSGELVPWIKSVNHENSSSSSVST